jgi:hypothetical protein
MSAADHTYSESIQPRDFNDSETSDTVLNGLGLAVADTGGVQMVQLVAAGLILGAAVGAAPLAAPFAVGYEAYKILGIGYEVYKFCQWLTSEE